MGLTELCDAVVLTISEEKGTVSFFANGQWKKIHSPAELSTLLEDMLQEAKEPAQNIRQTITFLFTRRYKTKATVFVSVFILWLMLAGQQNFEKNIDLTVSYRNIPENLVILDPVEHKVTITCRGLRKDVSLLNKENIVFYINLDSARPGTSLYNITTGNFSLPNNRVQLVNITPSKIELTLEKKEPAPVLPGS